MKPVFKYFGGKSNHIKKILHYLPCRPLFVDVFGGSGIVAQAYREKYLGSNAVIYNDADSRLTNFFTQLQSNFSELQKELNLRLYSREEFEIINPETASAADFFQLQQLSFGATGRGFSRAKKERPRGPSGFRDAIYRLGNFRYLWQHISIENLDFREIINKYASASTTFYLDPPYMCESGKTYKQTMNETDHVEMLDLVQSLPGYFVVSGYNNPLYEGVKWDSQTSWKTIEETNQTEVTEYLWSRNNGDV